MAPNNERLKHRGFTKAIQTRVENDLKDRKDEVYHIAIYLALVAQGTLLRPARTGQLRGLSLQLYGDYFRYGANRLEQKYFAKQKQFLSYTLAPKTSLQLRCPPQTYQVLLDQWLMFTDLHDRLTLHDTNVECVNADTYKMTTFVSANIAHRTISTLYPHMLFDEEFLTKAIGNELFYQLTFTATFSAENKIVSLFAESGFTEAWCDLLQDPILTARVMQQVHINESSYISLPLA